MESDVFSALELLELLLLELLLLHLTDPNLKKERGRGGDCSVDSSSESALMKLHLRRRDAIVCLWWLRMLVGAVLPILGNCCNRERKLGKLESSWSRAILRVCRMVCW